ncbi:MAG TPA: tetratricopeptide repeat protein [Candidatus Polarisedimenticolaceae bacterium]|nr:tetratricopeptide repeat protein [Candidatus Polarisedimenticolaceae bacterium]
MATTTKLTKKDMQQDEFIETVFDLGEWLEANWRRVAIVSGAIVVVVLIGLGWMSLSQRSSGAANDLLAKGMAAFQPEAAGGGKAPAPNYADALTNFQQAADKAGSGALGQVARLYQGRTLIAMGRAAEAVTLLTPLASSGNARLAAQAKVSLAEAAVASGDLERAATTLQDVIASSASSYPPDAATMRLASIRESQGKPAEARRLYDEVATKYPQSGFIAEAKQRSTDIASGK